VSPLKHTWAPRGETPTQYTRLDHHDRLNLIGGLGLTPARRKIRLHIQAHGRSITGEEVKRFFDPFVAADPWTDRSGMGSTSDPSPHKCASVY
jgi:hypothetical protein